MINLSVITNGLTRFGGQVFLVGKKYAPQILTYTGIGGFVATIICACKATTKAEKILNDRDEKIQMVNDCLDDATIEYDDEDAKKDLHDISIKTKWELTKCYAPVFTLGVASTALILGGHHIIQTRAAGYAAAFKASEKAFRLYREAVARKYGEDPNRMTLDDDEPKRLVEDWKKFKEEHPDGKQVLSETPTVYFAWFCKDTSKEWINSPQMNWFFLQRAQDDLNERLRGQGYLFLSDVRERLGLPYIPEGQVLGWILRKDREVGDNYIDFLHIGPDQHPNETIQALQRLEDVPYLLEFNCDGPILEEVGELVRNTIPKQFRRERRYAI